MPPERERGALLENDSRNPCVGCGPTNPRGLRLQFRRVGDEVVSDLVADETLEGWPERLHSGVLYLAMLEVANWTVYAFRDRVGLPLRTSALTLHRWVPTGTRLRLSGSLASRPDRGDLRVLVTAHDSKHGAVAALERDYALSPRADFVAQVGYDELPEVLEGLVPE